MAHKRLIFNTDLKDPEGNLGAKMLRQAAHEGGIE